MPRLALSHSAGMASSLHGATEKYDHLGKLQAKGTYMTAIEPFVGIIPIEDLQGAEEGVFEMLHMDRDDVMDQFDDVFEDTYIKCRENLVCKGMYISFDIDGIEGGEVRLQDGATLVSQQLAEVLNCADELVFYAITVHGYEELSKDPANSMFDSMFYDAWGVGYAMDCHRWIKAAIEERAQACGLHVGRSWIPGEGELDLGLQNEVFKIIDPSRIGIEFSESGLMRPVMTISGMRGVSSNPEIESAGQDIASYH